MEVASGSLVTASSCAARRAAPRLTVHAQLEPLLLRHAANENTYLHHTKCIQIKSVFTNSCLITR